MKSINLNRLQNVEYHALMLDTLKLVTESQLEGLTPLKTAMLPMVEQLNAGLMQVRKSEHTKKLNQLDEVRDNYFRGMVLRVQSENFSPDTALREKAYKLKILLDTYKNLTRENLRKQTDLVRNLLEELQSADYQAAATAVGLTGWITALQKANADFETLYDTRRDETASAPEINLSKIRKELDSQYRKLLKTIEAMEILQPSEAVSTLIAKLDAIFIKWNETLALRYPKKKQEQIASETRISEDDD